MLVLLLLFLRSLPVLSSLSLSLVVETEVSWNLGTGGGAERSLSLLPPLALVSLNLGTGGGGALNLGTGGGGIAGHPANAPSSTRSLSG